jgi:hypothetical protein
MRFPPGALGPYMGADQRKKEGRDFPHERGAMGQRPRGKKRKAIYDDTVILDFVWPNRKVPDRGLKIGHGTIGDGALVCRHEAFAWRC